MFKLNHQYNIADNNDDNDDDLIMKRVTMVQSLTISGV